jgi:dTMP kinase
MDLGLARDVEESFKVFQGRILDEYEAMAEEVGFHIIDATLSIEEQQRRMRDIVMNVLGDSLKKGVLRLPSGGDFNAQATATAATVL